MSTPTISAEEDVVTPGAEQGGIGDALRDYISRTRGGDVGALPAVLSLIVLGAVFTALRPSNSPAP